MELAHSLLLNEDALAQITEAKRPVFIFEWLRFLDKVLVAANKVIIQILSFSESESLEAFCNSIVLFFPSFLNAGGCKREAEEAGRTADGTNQQRSGTTD